MQNPISKYSDTELTRMIATGSHSVKSASFTELYNRYSQRIYIYCRKVFGDGTYAEDIFQETFLKFLKAAEEKNEITNTLSFLLRIARNLSLNHKRDNKQTFVAFEDYHFFLEENQLETKELTQAIEYAIELLADDYKEAFILQVYEGFTYNEIADLLDVPITTVRNRVVRAKSKLREILAPMLIE